MTQLNDFNDTAELPELHISRLLRCVSGDVEVCHSGRSPASFQNKNRLTDYSSLLNYNYSSDK